MTRQTVREGIEQARRLFGEAWCDVFRECPEVVDAVHRAKSRGELSYEARSRLAGQAFARELLKAMREL